MREQPKRFDPCCPSVTARLRLIDARINPCQLAEMVTEVIKHRNDITGKTEAELNTIAFQVELEYELDLMQHITHLLATKRADRATSKDFDAVLAAKIAEHASDDEEPEPIENEEVSEVDKPLIGGMRILHMKAAEGDLEAVMDLVNNKKALTNVKDNFNMTPLDRAVVMGHKKVADFLRNFH